MTRDRFDRFTEEARRVLTLAQDEARRFDHAHIGTEHLLLGLIREEDGVGARALTRLGRDLPKIRTAVEFVLQRGALPVVGEVGLTPGGKRVIELAVDEARGMGDRDISSGHLLLGLLREDEGIAAGVLRGLGVELARARGAVSIILDEDADGRRDAGRTDLPPRDVLYATEGDRVRRLHGLYGAVQGSPLRQVVPIGQLAEDAGVSVELISLEIRDAGCLLHWASHSPGRRPGLPDLRVRDDVGTPYVAGALGSTREGEDLRGHAVLAPAPPEAARRLQVDVEGFGTRRPLGRHAEEMRGRWSFTVDLDEAT